MIILMCTVGLGELFSKIVPLCYAPMLLTALIMLPSSVDYRGFQVACQNERCQVQSPLTLASAN